MLKTRAAGKGNETACSEKEYDNCKTKNKTQIT